MTNDFGKIKIEQKTGDEQLTLKGRETGLKLVDFWKWSVSDIVSNATRGRFAEFIVASAIKCNLEIIRDEWSAYDLTSPEGIKIEVKSASYLQSWFQRGFSKISFSIKESLIWDPETSKFSKKSSRQADVYVFCLLKHKDQPTLNPMDLDQWEFYVVPTSEINDYKRSGTSITLKSLQILSSAIAYDQLRQEIVKAYERQ
ncbi:MAG: hypothetical protein HUU01_15295 [Saprospiraceae bacterium]|nr:hypothetical protein [Saprospiraceae bacterium]